jgi:hypothetical protein
VRKAQLLEIAYYLSGPFPNVTELVITVASDDGRIEVETIHSAEILEWTNDGVSCAPDSYRTLDGADLDTVVEQVAALLETVLGEDKPAEVFEPMSRRNTYWVGLPAPDEVQQALRSAPTAPPAGYADITSLTDALAALRVRPSRPRGAGTAAAPRARSRGCLPRSAPSWTNWRTTRSPNSSVSWPCTTTSDAHPDWRSWSTATLTAAPR